MNIDTDLEIQRYQEATDMLSHAFNPEEMVGLPRQYNPLSRRNLIMQELPSGGYVQVGEEDLPQPQVMSTAPQQPTGLTRLEEAQKLRDTYKRQGQTLTQEDLDAAGLGDVVFDDVPDPRPKEVATEQIQREGPGQLKVDPTIRDNLHNFTREVFMNIGDYLGYIPGIPTNVEFQNFKIPEPMAEQLAGFVSGRNNLGVGAGDFVGLGSMTIEEGARTFEVGAQNDDKLLMALGALEYGLGVAEALPAFKPLSQGIKEGLRIVRQRLNQPGPMPTVGSNFGNVFASQKPKLMADPVLEAAGKETSAIVDNVTIGPPSEAPMVSQLAPEYRVTLQGVEPGGTGKQSFIVKNMTPANYQRMSSNLTELSEEFPDPLASEETYALMMGKVQNSVEVPKPPSWMIEHANNTEKWASWFKGLTPEQIKAADEGLSIQQDFRDAYAAGAGPELTGQLMLWSILSRRLSAFPHEAGYIELAEAAMPFIEKAAKGTWTDADTAEWLKVVPQAIPAGTPGKSSTNNANDFGKVFLAKMAAVDESGKSALTRLHEMIANPDMSSAEIRRAYYGLAQDTGIANKILSFALLVSGRNDVVVLDRIQINRMWAGGDKIYDDVYQQFEGAQGLAQYEALERSLAKTVPSMYEAAGRGDVGSVGRYHWESWVLSSGQVVSHPTLKGVVNAGAATNKRNAPPTANIPVSEGRFSKKVSGVQYEKMPDGSNRFIYETSTGEPFQFTKAQLDNMFKEAFSKKSGVLPDNFPGVNAFEGGNIPWFEFEGVDRGKLDELIRRSGKKVTQ